ncbi:MAG: acetylglutamate kinase [Dehalococcoidia bacterium]
MAQTIVAKVGGSTWESRDAALEDIVALQREGQLIVVVHGGGKTVDRWLEVHGVESEFVNGLRMTDENALPVVIAVLAGYTNKQLVAGLASLGLPAVGLSGADGLIKAQRIPDLGYVGEVKAVNVQLLNLLLDNGYMPVVAPIGVEGDGPQLLNINADTVAGEIAVALGAEYLIFLTDVPGVLDSDGKTVARLASAEAASMVRAGTISRGMLPKVDACLKASAAGTTALILDGRRAGSVRSALRGEPGGTKVG